MGFSKKVFFSLLFCSLSLRHELCAFDIPQVLVQNAGSEEGADHTNANLHPKLRHRLDAEPAKGSSLLTAATVFSETQTFPICLAHCLSLPSTISDLRPMGGHLGTSVFTQSRQRDAQLLRVFSTHGQGEQALKTREACTPIWSPSYTKGLAVAFTSLPCALALAPAGCHTQVV